MTAPIVWEITRAPMPNFFVEQGLLILGGDLLATVFPESRPAGQLWERLAEYAENHS